MHSRVQGQSLFTTPSYSRSRWAAHLLAAITLGLGGTAAAAPERELVVGQSVPLSGQHSTLGEQQRLGASIYFAHVNAAGGVRGARLRHVVLDDGITHDELVRESRELVESDGAIALMGYSSSASVEQLVKTRLLRSAQIALVGPATGGEKPRATPGENIFHVRASLADEAQRLVTHLTSVGIKNIAVLHQKDAEGEDTLAAVKSAMARLGTPLRSGASLAADGAGVERAVGALLEAAPEAVILAAQSAPSASFVQRYRAAGGTARLVGISAIDHNEVVRVAGLKAAHGMGFSQVVPLPMNLGVPVVREYHAMLLRYGPMNAQPTYAGLESFIGAKVLVKALRQARPNPTPGQVVAALEQLGSFDAGGFAVGFSRASRAGSRFVDLAIINRDGKLVR